MERHAFEASNIKLEHELCQRCEESRISVESVPPAVNESLEDQLDGRSWKIDDEDWDGAPKIGKLMETIQMGCSKVGKAPQA